MKWKIPLCSRGQTQILFLAKFENWTEQLRKTNWIKESFSRVMVTSAQILADTYIF